MIFFFSKIVYLSLLFFFFTIQSNANATRLEIAPSIILIPGAEAEKVIARLFDGASYEQFTDYPDFVFF